MLSQHMEATLDELGAALGGCERIASYRRCRSTYSVICIAALVYYLMLPFGLVDSIGWMMPQWSAVVLHLLRARALR